LLDQALKIFDESDYLKPEAARAHFKRCKVLRTLEQDHEAAGEAAHALRLFNDVVLPGERVASINKLDDEDFDHHIMFWSR
jgi:hypothetical protein